LKNTDTVVVDDEHRPEHYVIRYLCVVYVQYSTLFVPLGVVVQTTVRNFDKNKPVATSSHSQKRERENNNTQPKKMKKKIGEAVETLNSSVFYCTGRC
jgi:hypothetical protein